MIIIKRISTTVLRAHEEEWEDPGEIFDRVQIIGPFNTRHAAVRHAKTFDNGSWSWAIANVKAPR